MTTKDVSVSLRLQCIVTFCFSGTVHKLTYLHTYLFIPQIANCADLRSYLIAFIEGFVDFHGLLLGGACLFDSLVILCGQLVE